MPPAPSEVLEELMRSSPLAARYTEEVDRESAYEQLAARVRPAATEEDGGSPPRRARRTTDRPSRRPPAPAESPMEQVLKSGRSGRWRARWRPWWGGRSPAASAVLAAADASTVPFGSRFRQVRLPNVTVDGVGEQGLVAGGGRGIRTREGLPPTRFPSVRPRPLGESSAAEGTGGQQVNRSPREPRSRVIVC